MYTRLFSPPKNKSFFIFGPRGTGKTSWLKQQYLKAPYLDLLSAELINDLRANPSRLIDRIPAKYTGPIIIDEVQKLPELLDEVHRLIENKKNCQFILTGSSARKLRRTGVNLMAGRALLTKFFPLLIDEIGADFNLKKALRYGMLPSVWAESEPELFLESYLNIYLEQEIRLEGLARNIADFSRFLEAASFSQGTPLNISSVAQDCGVPRKSVQNYFEILEDLLIAYRLPVFARRAKRELIQHEKFYLFDVGVFRTIRPQGPLDSESEITGVALETFVFQQIYAHNEIFHWGFELYYWHTRDHKEIDFILYGQRGFFAIEVKSSSRIRDIDFASLLEFQKDYSAAKCILLYGGTRHYSHKGIEIIPIEKWCKELRYFF